MYLTKQMDRQPVDRQTDIQTVRWINKRSANKRYATNRTKHFALLEQLRKVISVEIA